MLHSAKRAATNAIVTPRPSSLRALAGTLAAALIFASGGSAKAATLEARASQSSVDVGDAVEVRLVVTGLGAGTAPSLGSYDVALSYDPSVFTFDGYTPSRVLGETDLHTMSEGAVVGDGTLEFYAVSFWPGFDLLSRQDGTVTLLTARFTATASGASSFVASLVAPLGDEHGDPIDGVGGVPPETLPDLVPLALPLETTNNALDVAVLVDARNQPADGVDDPCDGVDDPCDLDGDGVVTMLDARIYAAGCASADGGPGDESYTEPRHFCKVFRATLDETRCGDAGDGFTCGVRTALEAGTYWPIYPDKYPNQQCNSGTECPAVVAEDVVSAFFNREFGPYLAAHIVCQPTADRPFDTCLNSRHETIFFICPDGIEPGEEKAFCTSLWSDFTSTIGRNPILHDDFTCMPGFDLWLNVVNEDMSTCIWDETQPVASAECCATARNCEECATMKGCFNGLTPAQDAWLCTNVDEQDLFCGEHYALGLATLVPMPLLDADGDDVSDDNDLCPGTPASPPDLDADGCTSAQLTDVDGDGVGNDVDACPGTAPGAVVDAEGCSDAQRDDDGDGVPNGLDLCPGTDASPVDEAGCTEEQYLAPRGCALDLMVAKTESVDPVIAGSGAGNLVYTVTVTNAGPLDASGVTISYVLGLPAGVSLDSVVVSAGSFASPSWALGDLASGASETLTATLTVGPTAAPGTDVITAAAAVTGANEPLVSTGDDADDEATSIAWEADLTLAKDASPDPVLAGAELVYDVEVTNTGPSTAASVVVTDELPAGTTWVSDDCDAGPPAGQTLTWNVGSVAPSTTESCLVTVAVDPGASGTLLNGAAATTGATDPTLPNQASVEVVVVATEADLIVTLSSPSADPTKLGDPIVLDLEVMNAGPANATATEVDVDLSPHLAWISDDCSTTPGPGDTLIWSIGGMAPGETVVCSIETTVAGPGPIEVTASATAEQTDPTPEDATAQLAFGMLSILAVPTLVPIGLALLATLLVAAGMAILRRLFGSRS